MGAAAAAIVAGADALDRRPVVRYKPGQELGRGSIGIVHVAYDTCRGGREVALKQVRPQAADGGRVLRLERNLLEDLSHPHIVQLEDSFVSMEGHLVLVLELLLGGTLAAYVEQRPLLPEMHAGNLCMQMLRAVEYLHAQGIVHRDVKAENFVFGAADCQHLKLIDFGAAAMQGNSALSDVVGTPEYMAPEVARGRPYNNTCDMWSLGVVAFLLLTRRRDADAHHVALKPRSAPARDFVQRLLVGRPQDRMAAHTALQHEWLREVPYVPPPETCAASSCARCAKRGCSPQGCAAGLLQEARSSRCFGRKAVSDLQVASCTTQSPSAAGALCEERSPPPTLLQSISRGRVEASPMGKSSRSPLHLPRGALR